MPHDHTTNGPPEDREALLRAIADAYDALAENPDALAEERAERALWDTTLSDGLPPHP